MMDISKPDTVWPWRWNEIGQIKKFHSDLRAGVDAEESSAVGRAVFGCKKNAAAGEVSGAEKNCEIWPCTVYWIDRNERDAGSSITRDTGSSVTRSL